MRRKDREVAEPSAIAEILDKCQALRVAFPAEYPYVVPVSFGYTREGAKFTLYFHSAKEGRKVDIVAANTPCKVGFEADRVIDVGSIGGESPCRWTCWFESVIGEGIVALVADDAEKRAGLDAIMKHYGYQGALDYDAKSFDLAYVYKLEVVAICGKRR